jgi:hypothetical protein
MQPFVYASPRTWALDTELILKATKNEYNVGGTVFL